VLVSICTVKFMFLSLLFCVLIHFSCQHEKIKWQQCAQNSAQNSSLAYTEFRHFQGEQATLSQRMRTAMLYCLYNQRKHSQCCMACITSDSITLTPNTHHQPSPSKKKRKGSHMTLFVCFSFEVMCLLSVFQYLLWQTCGMDIFVSILWHL
jgi:hypothetical protein